MSGVSNIVDLNSIGIVCLIGFCDCSFRKPLLNKYDIFIVTADHGNDPTIGHSQHTRERVPLLVWYNGLQGFKLGERSTMADTTSTVAAYFDVKSPQHDDSYLNLIV